MRRESCLTASSCNVDMRVNESGNGKKPFTIHLLHGIKPFWDGNILCNGGNAIVDDQDIAGSKGIGRKNGGITYKNSGHDVFLWKEPSPLSRRRSGVSRVMLMLNAA